ncbi:hypothetical protein T492DRAFT_1082017 [Pavlovales sp. CCMP2436]|nr:hypothetical protein T492DRAFT_1082017 [Pavlovales sp. CCMP2436]|mmetsp:Transcript_9701/g.23297  ORF Transcript_9701/g.23297 Transcript_9701/m.23297 type:complete len:217 (+) Transcript_9701:122-772(+)
MTIAGAQALMARRAREAAQARLVDDDDDDDTQRRAIILFARDPALLLERCSRQLGWDAAKSAGVLVEYERFMRLKVKRKDFDARKLSPSLAIDEMWHRHILDMKAYASDCMALCGAVIYHDADGDRDTMGRRRRVLTTLHHYHRVCSQEPPAAVWAFGDEIFDATLRPDASSAAAGGSTAAEGRADAHPVPMKCHRAVRVSACPAGACGGGRERAR